MRTINVKNRGLWGVKKEVEFLSRGRVVKTVRYKNSGEMMPDIHEWIRSW